MINTKVGIISDFVLEELRTTTKILSHYCRILDRQCDPAYTEICESHSLRQLVLHVRVEKEIILK
jgi:hypothetical protein